MNDLQLKELNGERLMHRVWIEKDGRVKGISDQLIEHLPKIIAENNVVKIECQGYSVESKIRQIERYGD